MKKIHIEPNRVASFRPGRDKAVLERPGRAPRLAEPGEILRTNTIKDAPLERLPENFLAAMRAKGWLRDR